MDQTLSLSHQTPPAPASVAPDSATAGALSQAPVPEEEPESPGRSPRQEIPPLPGSDPLAEGIAIVAGIALALMAIVVPLATVVSDSRPGETSETVRATW